MYAKLLKDHPAGLPKGYIIKCRNDRHKAMLIEKKMAESATQSDFEKFKKDAPQALIEYNAKVKADAERLIKEAKEEK